MTNEPISRAQLILAAISLVLWLCLLPIFEFIAANPFFAFFYEFSRVHLAMILMGAGAAPIAFAVGMFLVSQRLGFGLAFVRVILCGSSAIAASMTFNHLYGSAPNEVLLAATLAGAAALTCAAIYKTKDLLFCVATAAVVLVPITSYKVYTENNRLFTSSAEHATQVASSKANDEIIAILLDGTDLTSSYLDDNNLPREDILPNLHRHLKSDFHWFYNAWSNGVQTYLSVPSIFTGRLPVNRRNSFLRNEPTIFSRLIGRYDIKGFFRGGHDHFCHSHRASCAPFRDTSISNDGVLVLAKVLLHMASFKTFELGFEPGKFIPLAQDEATLETFLREVAQTKTPGTFFFAHLFERSLVKLRHFDEVFGMLIDMLKQNGRYENSTILLMSDHGMDWSQPCVYGVKCIPNSRILRVPLAIKRAGSGQGEIDAYPAQNIDIAPTLLGLVAPDIDLPAGTFNGIDLFKSRPDRALRFNAGDDYPRAFSRTPDGINKWSR